MAAVCVAAHECGHAIQHNINYAPLNIRSAIVPVANIGSSLSWPIFLLGLILSIPALTTVGIVLFSLAVLFQLVTLPVEFNASSRALKMLESTAFVPSSGMLYIKPQDKGAIPKRTQITSPSTLRRVPTPLPHDHFHIIHGTDNCR